MVGEILTAGDVGRLAAISSVATDDKIPVYDKSTKQLKYCTADQISTGASAVDGPSSATDDAIPTFDGETGKLIQNTTATLTSTALTINAINIVTDTTTGTKIGTGATQKLGLWNATPVVQPSGTAVTTAGFTAGSGAAVLVDSTFTGDNGSTAYHISDIVAALKLIGVLAV